MIIRLKQNVLLTTLAILGLSVVSLLVAQPAAAANPKDCDNNAIIYCGLSDADPKGDFVKKYNQNVSGDLDAIYGYNGIELDAIHKYAGVGYVTREGNVYLNGQLVATDAISLGRQQRPNGTSIVGDNGRTYYYSSTRDSFAAAQIPAIVVMNGNKFDQAILTSCGNPVKGNPTGKAPEYSCDTLSRTKIDNQTFDFSTKATALNGAVVAKVVYDFGDGTKIERANPTEVVRHSYATPGSYKATVTVFITVNGVTFPLEDICEKQIEAQALHQPPAPKPIQACTGLNATPLIDNKRKFRFTATAQAENGAVLRSADFNFGDGTKQENIAPTATNEVSVEYEYTKTGSHIVKATLYFNTPNGVEDDTCTTSANIPEDTPTATTTSSKQNPTPPATTKVTDQLPSTGPAEVLAGVVGIGSIGAAGYYYTTSRRNLLGTMLKQR